MKIPGSPADPITQEEEVMEVFEAIKGRRSIRQFRPDPVPKEVLEDILDCARWAPSYKNSQPWELVVVSGKKKEALSEMLLGLLRRQVSPVPDITHPATWPPKEESRVNRLMTARALMAGRSLDDPQALKEAQAANFKFYGAPHVIYLFQEGSLSMWSLFDLGLFSQSLMLAAYSKGLGTVPQAFVTLYAKEIKEFLNIPLSKKLVIGISIGYPDWDSPVNQFRSERDGVDGFSTWLE